MTEPGRLRGSDGGRRGKRFLSPSEKYEIWVGLLRGEYTTVQAAERAGVDRRTIMRVRQASKPGVRTGGVDPQLTPASAAASSLASPRAIAAQNR